jgi:putative FmdB family regulatory protein
VAPTYEYMCEGCGYLFDELQSIKAEPLKDCPRCAEPKLVRLVSGGVGTIFVGAGWPSKENAVQTSDIYKLQKSVADKQYQE